MADVIGAIVGLAVVALIGYVIYKVFRDNGNDRTLSDERILEHHERLTLKAARASRKGRTGEANVYQEAADRLLAAWRERKQC